MSVIRKISIGPDYPRSMSYTVGQSVMPEIGAFKIHSIKVDQNSMMYVKIVDDKNQVSTWKVLTPSMPIVVEYDLAFLKT